MYSFESGSQKLKGSQELFCKRLVQVKTVKQKHKKLDEKAID